jgi:rhodanese-related sulfurtransferase
VAAKKEAAKVVGEALVVAILGTLLALITNAVSPVGLTLSRNYFPGGNQPRATSHIPPQSLGTNNPSPFEVLAAEFQAKGLVLAESNQVIRLFHDPRREQNRVLFIDARKDDDYQKGHIPGAWRYDYVHHEDYLPSIAPLCLGAEQIVVYCGGGSCELSEFAAIDLRDILSLPKEKLLVYGGGFTEWTNNRLPIEEGDRASGKVSVPK